MDPFAAVMNAALTEEHVVWFYRCLLGRNPESIDVVTWYLDKQITFSQCRDEIISSEEFKLINLQNKPVQYYIPEPGPYPFRKSRKRLCLSAIVKNEERHISNMLSSCAALIDFAVIVDTGSTDETINLARSTLTKHGIPHIIHSVPFVNFAQARNAALDQTPDDIDWILVLDADEEIVPEDYARFYPLLEAENAQGWQLPRFLFSDAAKRKPIQPYPDFQMRLFRNNLDHPVRFTGNVHERPANVEWKKADVARCELGEAGGPHIHHLGYMDITYENWKKKHEFYESLANEGVVAGSVQDHPK